MNSKNEGNKETNTPSTPVCSEAASTRTIQSTSVSTTPKKRKSAAVWNYFQTAVRDQKYINQCIKCKKVYSINSGNVTLVAHAQTHGFLLDQDNRRQCYFTPTGDITSQNTVSIPRSERYLSITKQIIKLIVCMCLPFCIVEKHEFVKLLNLLDPDYNVLSRRSIKRDIVREYISMRARVRSFISQSAKSISITTDSWSSRVYKWYICIIAHWIDEKWALRSTLLDFKRFATPHTGEAAATVIKSVLEEWDIVEKIYSVTTDNASDIIKAISALNEKINRSPIHHIRCVAHVINLVLKDCLSVVQKEVCDIRSLLNSIRFSVKRRDLLDTVKVELGLHSVCIPGLDVPKRWSSTFHMLKSVYTCRRVLNSVCHRTVDLQSSVVSDAEWEKYKKIQEFLELAASITKEQSGSLYVTISICAHAYKKFIERCQSIIDQQDDNLEEIAKLMMSNLNTYKPIIFNNLSALATTDYLRISSDIIANRDILRKFIQIQHSELQSNTEDEHEQPASLLAELIQEGNVVYSVNTDEISRFLQETAMGCENVDLLLWWSSNGSRFPNLSNLARQFLAVPPSSVPS